MIHKWWACTNNNNGLISIIILQCRWVYDYTFFRIQLGAVGLKLKLLAVPKGLWEDKLLNMTCKTHLLIFLIKHSELYYIIFYFTLLLLLRGYEIPGVTFAWAQFSRKIQVGNCRSEISKMGRELQKWAEPPKWGGVYSRKDFHHWLWLQPIVIDLLFKIKFYKLKIVSSWSNIKYAV